MKTFCFTIDDNVRCLAEINESQPSSMFDHPYLAMLHRLHRQFDLKIQLNLFYEASGFTLSDMTDRYRGEFAANSGWLKLSFHSRKENSRPYQNASYDEVFADCEAVQSEILRFACPAALAKTTTVHYCQTTSEGTAALADNGVLGLLGLFGTHEAPRTSYGIEESVAKDIRNGQILSVDGMAYASIDMIINKLKKEELSPALEALMTRDSLCVMIHEQYFYGDYKAYQPDFEEKLTAVFSHLTENGYQSRFFEELITPSPQKNT